MMLPYKIFANPVQSAAAVARTVFFIYNPQKNTNRSACFLKRKP